MDAWTNSPLPLVEKGGLGELYFNGAVRDAVLRLQPVERIEEAGVFEMGPGQVDRYRHKGCPSSIQRRRVAQTASKT